MVRKGYICGFKKNMTILDVFITDKNGIQIAHTEPKKEVDDIEAYRKEVKQEYEKHGIKEFTVTFRHTNKPIKN